MNQIQQTTPVTALIFAGGSGVRMNSKALPKQFLKLYGKPIIIRTLEIFDQHPEISDIVVACLESHIPQLEEFLQKFQIRKVSAILPGGTTGQLSIYNGLTELEKHHSEALVLIHDGVRPMITPEAISENIAIAREQGAAITGAPVVETIVVPNEISGHPHTIINRDRCRIARAPQTFKLSQLLAAHRAALAKGIVNYLDSLSLMTDYGVFAPIIDGPLENIKITTPQDFYLCKALLEARENQSIELL